MSGWICLHREITDHWIWQGEPYSKAQAWVDLVIHANHTNTRITIKGQHVNLKRGQQARSELTLSKTWGWSRGKVRRFLKILENESMIVQQTGHLTSVITVCNYSVYQDLNKKAVQQKEQQTVQQTVQQTDSRRYTDNNDNNDNNETNTPKPPLVDLPGWLDIELWEEWLKTRTRLKSPNTKRALQTQINKLITLEKKQPGLGNLALEQANGSGWKGIYEPKDPINGKDLIKPKEKLMPQLFEGRNGTNQRSMNNEHG